MKSRDLFVFFTMKFPSAYHNAWFSTITEAGTGLGWGEAGAEERNLATSQTFVYGHWRTF